MRQLPLTYRIALDYAVIDGNYCSEFSFEDPRCAKFSVLTTKPNASTHKHSHMLLHANLGQATGRRLKAGDKEMVRKRNGTKPVEHKAKV